MSVPSRVRFHITEAGPKKCVAVKACPIAEKSTHYDNYLDAARAYESQLASSNEAFTPLLTKMSEITYESLREPHQDDIGQAIWKIKDYFFRGIGPLSIQAKELHREMWFDNQLERVANVTPEDRQKLATLRQELTQAKSGGATAGDRRVREINTSIENIVAEYRTKESKARYGAFIDDYLKQSQEVTQLARTIAAPKSKEFSFARALDNQVALPKAISREFETIWNSDEFTTGSQKYIETKLRTCIKKQKEIIDNPNRESASNRMGFPNAQKAFAALLMEAIELRRHHHYRGRSYPSTIATVVDKLDLK